VSCTPTASGPAAPAKPDDNKPKPCDKYTAEAVSEILTNFMSNSLDDNKDLFSKFDIKVCSRREIKFPRYLSSYHRMLVHDACKERDLQQK